MGFFDFLGRIFKKPLSSPEIFAPWMSFVLKEVGVTEVPGPTANARIIEYHAETSLKAGSDEIAWCSAFTNWVMKQVNIKGTRSAAALSWKYWGQGLKSPKYGCVVVFDHGRGKGHVTFFDHEKDEMLACIGGNQSNSVKLSYYSKKELVGYRWPDEN